MHGIIGGKLIIHRLITRPIASLIAFMKSKSVLLTLAKFAIPITIIWFLLANHVTDEQWHDLKTHPKDYGLLAAALVVAIAAMSLSFARWCILVRCHDIELSMVEAFRLGSICFLLSFVSVGSVGGDLFKAVFLAKRRPGKRVEAVASVLVDRGVGLYGLLLIVAIGLLFLAPTDTASLVDDGTESSTVNIPTIKNATLALTALGSIVLAILVFGGKAVDGLIQRGIKLPVVGTLIQRIGPPLRMFGDHPIAFGVSIIMSMGVHIGFVISMYLIATAMYPDTPTLSDHFVIVPIGLLASALPITPGGVGVLEGTIEGLYRIIPTTPTSASGTMVALVFEAVKVIMALIGTAFYWAANEEVKESLEAAEEEGAQQNQES